MKITQEERNKTKVKLPKDFGKMKGMSHADLVKELFEDKIKEIKVNLKVVKFNMRSWKNIPKWASLYEKDVAYLLKALAKAQKPSV